VLARQVLQMQQQRWQQQLTQQLERQEIPPCLMQLPTLLLAAAAEQYRKSRRTKATC
jgi:hypothetical protein